MTYAKYIVSAFVIISLVATSQQLLFVDTIQPGFYLIPAFVAMVIGSLLANAAILRCRLRQQRTQFRAITDMAMEFTYYRTVAGNYEYVSPFCREITGYDQQEFLDCPNLMDKLVHEEDRHLWEYHVHDINDGGLPQALDIRLIAKNGNTIWISHLCSPVYNELGQQIGVRSTNMNITERKLYERQFKHMALYDPLTDLPNRRSLERKLNEYIYDMGELDTFAVFFLDLSRFKNINDNFGHTFGDRLLITIADRLKNLDHDLFVSRFGGDEFVLLAPNVKTSHQALEMADEILASVEKPVETEGVELYVSGGIGVSFYPRDGQEPETLISRADTAMYKAKGERANTSMYSVKLGDQVEHFVSTEHKIHKGLENGEFGIFYQPKVDLMSGRIAGVEALLRWEHPDQGLILPGEFIHIAEETGQIVELGNLALHQVMSDLLKWQQQGMAVSAAINISARQFSNQQCYDNWVKQLQSFQGDHSLIELEVTEQVFLGDIERASRRLQTFRDIGTSIALDDFGTGYSSLNYLKQLPIDTLKVDISFIRDIQQGNRAYAILKAILQMARDLQLKAVAEGIETHQQAQLLKELHCELAQGYLFYKPIPVKQLEGLLMHQSRENIN